MDRDDFLDKYENCSYSYYYNKILLKLNHEQIFNKDLFNQIIDIINDSEQLDDNIDLLICDDAIKYSDEQMKRVEDLFNFCSSHNINCYFRQGRTNFSLEEIKNAKKQILDFANKVKSQNLSPIEQLLSVYFHVTKREYKDSINETRIELSRTVYGVLNFNYIICVGFSELFEAIMNEINTKDVKIYQNSLVVNNSRHSDLIVYVKDKKYNVDGYYFLDPTYDSRYDRPQAYRLSFFLIPLNDMKKINSTITLDDYTELNYTSRDDGKNRDILEHYRKYNTTEGNISLKANEGYIGITTLKEILENQVFKNTTIDLLENRIGEDLQLIDLYISDNTKKKEIKYLERNINKCYKKINILTQNNFDEDNLDLLKQDIFNTLSYLSAPIPLKIIKNVIKTYLKTNNKDLTKEQLDLCVKAILLLNSENDKIYYKSNAKNCFVGEKDKIGEIDIEK